MIDYHDILLPFIEKINSLPDRKAYASRTILCYTPNGILSPIVIELSLPPSPPSPSNKRVFTHGHDATTHWIWKLAKAHVCSNDAGIHQLVNHWYDRNAHPGFNFWNFGSIFDQRCNILLENFSFGL